MPAVPIAFQNNGWADSIPESPYPTALRNTAAGVIESRSPITTNPERDYRGLFPGSGVRQICECRSCTADLRPSAAG